MTALAPQVLTKLPAENLQFGIDFSGKMATDETITQINTLLPDDPALILTNQVFGTNFITFFASGGAAGVNYEITTSTTTNIGQVLEAVVRLAVLDSAASGYPPGDRPTIRLNTLYTSVIEMESIFSIPGVFLRSDDNRTVIIESDETANVLDVIEEATDTLNLFLGHRYDNTALSTSSMVRRWASYLACHFLSIRRGQGALYSARVDDIYAMMERIKSGEMILPGLGTKEDFTPAMSNLVVDDRFAISKLRVQQNISTGGTSSRQDADPRVPWNRYWSWY